MSLLEARHLVPDIGTETRAIALSFTADPGEAVRISGPSGSGKTTLLRAVARLIPVLEGEVTLRGSSWKSYLSTQWRTTVTYLHQTPVLFPGSVESNLRHAFRFRRNASESTDIEGARSLLSELRLREDILERDAATLSGGEAARVALVRSLLIHPTVLLLDEPTAALDDEARHALIGMLTRWLAENERALVLVSHDEAPGGELRARDVYLTD